MSSIGRRADGSWRARYRDSDGREHARHFDRKIDAQRWLDEMTASIVRGDYVDPAAGKITLRRHAEAWQASHVGRPGTASLLDNALRLHILPALGDRPLDSLRRSDVQALVKTLSAKLSPGTVRNIYEFLNRIMQAAVDDRLIAHSPCRRIVLPARSEVEPIPPTPGEVQALADAVPPRFRAVVVLLAGSGLRIGEALGLKTSDVNFLRRTVRVERQRLQDGSIGPTKTAKSTRTVPLGQIVVDELAQHVAAHGASEWLFTASDGRPLSYRQWKTIWRHALRENGLDLDTHSLRHFTASALIAGGASVKQVQTVLGHSSAAITLRVYAHLWPGDEERTRKILDTALELLADSLRTRGLAKR